MLHKQQLAKPGLSHDSSPAQNKHPCKFILMIKHEAVCRRKLEIRPAILGCAVGKISRAMMTQRNEWIKQHKSSFQGGGGRTTGDLLL